MDLELNDSLAYARMIQREYAEGLDADLPAFLQCAYYAYLRFRNHPEFFAESLTYDEYWESGETGRIQR